jgi:hypothetical protein
MKQAVGNGDLVIQIPRRIFNNKRVQQLLCEINFSSIEGKSKASQKDIDKFLAYAKSKRGKFVKSLLDKIKDKV